MNLDKYIPHKQNSGGWKSYIKQEGVHVYTYEPMNCRELTHKSHNEAILFLEREGYKFLPNVKEDLPPEAENMTLFTEN